MAMSTAGTRSKAPMTNCSKLFIPGVPAKSQAWPQISWGPQSMGILLSRFVVRRVARARRTRLVAGADALRVGGRKTTRRILFSIDGLRHARQHLLPHHFTVEQRHIEDWDARERLLYLEPVTLVDALPLLKKLIVEVAW